MLHTPSGSPRMALSAKTNTLDSAHCHNTLPPKPITFLPTPPAEKKPKRRILVDENSPAKRIKLHKTYAYDEDSDVENVEEEQYMEDVASAQGRAMRNTTYQLYNRFISGPLTGCRRYAPSTTPVLYSFVSSNKADTFKCHSVGLDTYLTPPYACSYSHAAKAGGAPHLAVATEQGTIHILNTSKRQEWDAEAARVSHQAHNNGIFDIKWSLDDTLLATCSGDQSVRITDMQTGEITHVLHGHNSTVKCVAWDVTNHNLLATGGRDGAISLWDLRIGLDPQQDNLSITKPVITIHSAHEDIAVKAKSKARKGNQHHVPRTVTSILYPGLQPYGLVSSGSYDGILRYWDLRKPKSFTKSKSPKPVIPAELYSSPIDPTTYHGSKRPRGVINLASGTGPSAGLIFAIGTDSRINTYDVRTLSAQSSIFSHENLQTTSFYVGLSVSPCGRWLACGGSAKRGNSFIFNIENAGRPGFMPRQGVEFKGQAGDVGAVDWAQDALATCLDDGVVRIWRPNVETYSRCLESPEESRWDWLWSA